MKVKILLASLAFASLAGCSKPDPGNIKKPGSTLSQKENFDQEVKTGQLFLKLQSLAYFFVRNSK